MTHIIMPFDEMMEFILSGKDANGDPIDIRKWLKTPEMLHEEDREREVRLFARGDRRVRSAVNSRVRIETRTRELLEVARVFTLPNGEEITLEGKKTYALSETQKLNMCETPMDTAIRGLEEEMKIVAETPLIPRAGKNVPEGATASAEIVDRESSVFIGLITYNTTSTFLYETTDSYWKSSKHLEKIFEEGHVIYDKNVRIYQRWFDKE